MDHYGYDRWDGGHPWFWMVLMMLVVVIAIGITAYVVLRSTRQQPQAPPMPTQDAAARILDERFARGEIDAEDYKVRRDLLRPG